MPCVTLKELNEDSFSDICKLSDTLTKEQQSCVAPNVYSIAEASFHPESAWFRGIYVDDEPAGFVMLSLDIDDIPEEEKPGVYLWRFMMGLEFQSKGYGKRVLDMIVEQCRSQGNKVMYTSCDMGDVSPYGFYMKYGFEDTGKTLDDCDEQVLKFSL